MSNKLYRHLMTTVLVVGLPLANDVHASTQLPVSGTVTVLPLHNATGEPELDWMSIGLQDSLTVDLWWVSALNTRPLIWYDDQVTQVCPDLKLSCIAGQDRSAWHTRTATFADGGYVWGEYRRDADGIVLKLSWYGPETESPWAEEEVRGSDLTELLKASSDALSRLLADRSISVTQPEAERMRLAKTNSPDAWINNALGYWDQLRYHHVSDDAQRREVAAEWSKKLLTAVHSDPNYAEAWNNLGYHYVAQESDQSRSAFEKALAIKPDLIDSLIGASTALSAEGNHGAAVETSARAVVLNPSLTEHRRILLSTYSSAGQPEQGLSALVGMDEFLQAHGSEVERQDLNIWRAQYYEELNQWEAALSSLSEWDRALAARGDSARTDRLDLAERLENTGKVLMERKLFSNAEAYDRKAVEILEDIRGADDASVARMLQHLAEAVAKQGQCAESETILQRAQGIWDGKQAALKNRLQDMGWDQLPAPAHEWWQAFLDTNPQSPDIILILLDELSKRKATLEQFYDVYLTSCATSVPDVLKELDQQRIENLIRRHKLIEA